MDQSPSAIISSIIETDPRFSNEIWNFTEVSDISDKYYSIGEVAYEKIKNNYQKRFDKLSYLMFDPMYKTSQKFLTLDQILSILYRKPHCTYESLMHYLNISTEEFITIQKTIDTDLIEDMFDCKITTYSNIILEFIKLCNEITIETCAETLDELNVIDFKNIIKYVYVAFALLTYFTDVY